MHSSESLRFAVVTPSYNQGPFIERTVRSVLDQGLDALDYWVIDGGSDDETVDVLRRFDGRLRWVSEEDDGQADAVNKGLEKSRGELIGWLNSDDVYSPGALARVRDLFAAHPEVDVVYGDAHHIDETDAVIESYYTEPWDPERLRQVCFLCQPAVFFRRRVIDACGALDAGLHFCMDYEYWLRLDRCGMRFAYLPEVLAGSRLYATNKTLGQRVKVHTEINDMMRDTYGAVPDRWLSNYAHALLETSNLARDRTPLRFSTTVSLLSWLASLCWNGRVSSDLWQTTREWMRAGLGDSQRERGSLSDSGSPLPLGEGLGVRARIGFDVSQTGTEKAGCGYEADSLIQALAEIDDEHDYLLYPTFGDGFWDSGGGEATRQVDQPNFQRGPGQASHAAAREFWRSPPADLEAHLGYPDIVHSHNFFCPEGLEHARLVYTIHDLSFLVHPDWSKELNRQICFEGVFRASLHADMVLAVSEATRRHFLEVFPHYPAERTAVTHLASRFTDREAVERPSELTALEKNRFWLNVGTIEPRKNQLRLLEAYRRYVETSADPLPLAFAGGAGWLMDDFDQRIEDLGLESRVLRLGYTDDTGLRWLYQNCFAFLYPSLFEGFGLPVVEALSQGAAVVTSQATSLPEVVGDAGLLVDPESVEEIHEAMTRLSSEDGLHAALRAAAPEQASRFSWRQTAEEVLRCYRRVLEMGKR